MGSESAVERKVCSNFARHGWLVEKQAKTNINGAFDRIVTLQWFTGRIEFKAFGEPPSELQMRYARRYLRHGQDCRVIDNIHDGELLREEWEAIVFSLAPFHSNPWLDAYKRFSA